MANQQLNKQLAASSDSIHTLYKSNTKKLQYCFLKPLLAAHKSKLSNHMRHRKPHETKTIKAIKIRMEKQLEKKKRQQIF